MRKRKSKAAQRLELLPFGPDRQLRKMGQNRRKHVLRTMERVSRVAMATADINALTDRELAALVRKDSGWVYKHVSVMHAAAVHAGNLAMAMDRARERGIAALDRYTTGGSHT